MFPKYTNFAVIKVLCYMNRLECSALRGIAILGIVLHNFAHQLPGAALENEFAFNAERNAYFWQSLISSDWLIHIFSYTGHLGVPVFVFLSGYGLVQKYDKCERIKIVDFLKSHYKKLFVPMLIGTFFYLVVSLVIKGQFTFFIPRLIVQCSLLLNLVYPYEMHFSPGPYWYFGMTMQLYVIYVFLLYKKSLKTLAVLTIVSVMAQFLLYENESVLAWVRYNSIGWLLPFLLGILMARNNFELEGKKQYMYVSMGMLMILLVVMSFNFFMWLFIPCVFILLSICVIKILPEIIIKPFGVIGSISLYIFVVHPIIREIMMPLAHISNAPYVCWLTYGILTIFIAFVISNANVIVSCKSFIRYVWYLFRTRDKTN